MCRNALQQALHKMCTHSTSFHSVSEQHTLSLRSPLCMHQLTRTASHATDHNQPEMFMQCPQFVCSHVVQKTSQLLFPQVTMGHQCLLQRPTINEQEFDVGSCLFMLHLILQRCQHYYVRYRPACQTKVWSSQLVKSAQRTLVKHWLHLVEQRKGNMQPTQTSCVTCHHDYCTTEVK